MTAAGAVLADIRDRLARIGAREPSLHAFAEWPGAGLDAAGALARAEALDRLPERERGPLHGVAVGLKELFDRRGRVVAWGSPIHAARRAAADAALVERLEAAGAVILGETTSTEFAIARAGATVNPHDAARSPGGSSSGSAALVGAGLAPLAIGSQTIGSVVRPAAYCGVVGVKPSHGALSLEGAMPLAPTLDAPGVFADRVETAAAALAALGLRTSSAPAPTRAIRVARWFPEPLSAAAEAALDRAQAALEAAGVSVEPGEVPREAREVEAETARVILEVEAARAHAGDLARSADRMSPVLRDTLTRGAATSDQRYRDALAARDAMRAQMARWLPSGAVVLCAPAVAVAPLLEDGTGERAPQRLWTTLGWAAASVPAMWRQGLPLGAQLVARDGEDAALLALAATLEAGLAAA